MIRRPPRSTRTTHSFPTRRSSDLMDDDFGTRSAPYRPPPGSEPGRRGRALSALDCIPPRELTSPGDCRQSTRSARSEEHTSELQSLMRISYAVFCLKKQKHHQQQEQQTKY